MLDLIILDWATHINKVPVDKKNVVLIVLPGLTASAREPYVRNMAAEALNNGYDVVVYHNRGNEVEMIVRHPLLSIKIIPFSCLKKAILIRLKTSNVPWTLSEKNTLTILSLPLDTPLALIPLSIIWGNSKKVMESKLQHLLPIPLIS